MPKIKTHKATQKRFRKTGKNKLMRRKAGQDHFNSREAGNTTIIKRRDVSADAGFVKTINKLTPYQ